MFNPVCLSYGYLISETCKHNSLWKILLQEVMIKDVLRVDSCNYICVTSLLILSFLCHNQMVLIPMFLFSNKSCQDAELNAFFVLLRHIFIDVVLRMFQHFHRSYFYDFLPISIGQNCIPKNFPVL